MLANLPRKGVDVSNVMISVTADVVAHTGSEQTPVAESSLTRQVFLAGEGTADESPETALWRAAAPARDGDLLQVYLTRYPTGAHANDARSLIAGAAAKPARDRSTEEELWRIAFSTREPAMIDLYLTRFPDGAHAQGRRGAGGGGAGGGQGSGFLCDRLATHPHDATASAPGVELEALAATSAAAIAACERARAAAPQRRITRRCWRAPTTPLSASTRRCGSTVGRSGRRRARDLEPGPADGARRPLPKDVAGAYALYEKAAERGLPDGAIDVAVALTEGKVLQKDVGRAYQLLKGRRRCGLGDRDLRSRQVRRRRVGRTAGRGAGSVPPRRGARRT